jgi:hypothetical protein
MTDSAAEVRAAGIICPSCGRNWADLYGDHDLIITGTQAECRDGQPVSIEDDFEAACAAANAALLDDFWRREAIALRALGYPV